MEPKEIEEASFFYEEETHISLRQVQDIYGLTKDDIQALIDFKILEASQGSESQWCISCQTLTKVKIAGRLKNDFDLESGGLALALTYLYRIEELEKQVQRLRCHIFEK